MVEIIHYRNINIPISALLKIQAVPSSGHTSVIFRIRNMPV